MYYDIIVKRTERAIIMGVYLNPNNQNFYEAVNKEIYVDKSLLIERIEYLKEKVNKNHLLHYLYFFLYKVLIF